MTIDRPLAVSSVSEHWTTIEIAKPASAVAVIGLLLVLRRWIKSPYAMPGALLVMWLGGVSFCGCYGCPIPDTAGTCPRWER